MSCSLNEDLGGCLGTLGCCFRTKPSIGSVDAAESVEETCFEVFEQWILSCCWEAGFLSSSVSCRELKLLRWVIPRIICPARFSSTKMYYNNSNPCFKNQTIQVEQQQISIPIFVLDSNCTSWEPKMPLIRATSRVWNLEFYNVGISLPISCQQARSIVIASSTSPTSSIRKKSRIGIGIGIQNPRKWESSIKSVDADDEEK